MGELCEWVNGWSVDGWWVVYTYMPSTCSVVVPSVVDEAAMLVEPREETLESCKRT